MGVGAAGDALVLGLGSISDYSCFLEFHVGFDGVSVHARAMFFNPMLVHWRTCQRLKNLGFCNIVPSR